ncbi:MAG: methyltransferase domain-containing protein, partial [Gemmatimonadaceae bacterium]
ELLASRVKAAQLGNVTIVRGDPHDPRLPPDTLDAALMIHMYHEISDPYALLWNLARSLRPSARLAILDSTQPTDRHGTPPWLLECELSLAGYVKERTIPIARDQSLGIFRAPAPDSLPSPASMRARAVAGACRQP